ncbi:MFS 1 domain containing protein [Asbolus verrucosus]|uniref:MFS 1 domain containing protein n=1 Tax=Asbolus verrucosus TaxID=1661398 RepID=A0A482VJP4_ASBVE|nr:MFS 1 domain containing protein [Asbolus verrucosus]
MKQDQRNSKDNEKYELLPPEGGWGYLIAVALTLTCNVTLIPMTCFGLIFGKFLASIGDETTGTTLANGIFNTCFNITGLAANSLLQRYSYRMVAFMGAGLFFLGSFATIFVTTLPQMIVSFGVIQGLGMGLLFPALFTALNSYFDRRLSLINSVAQAFMVAASMVFPYVGQHFMTTYGFRGTVGVISAMSLNAVLAAALLQPVEWHLKKKRISAEREDLLVNEEKLVLPKPRASIISIGDRALSVSTIDKLGKIKDEGNEGWWKALVKSMDLGMFKDPVYVNISVGLALGFTADVAFISIIPLVLINAGLSTDQTAFLMSLFFASDLAARILLSIVSALCNIKNRYVFLGGAFLLVIFRTAFVLRNDFYWKMVTVSAVGFLRCFIQTPLPLVISEQYANNFATAFSLYMVVCGVVSLIFGPLMSYVKAWTQSDVMVVHLLTLAYLTCVVSWSAELIYKKIRRSK